MIGEPLDPAGHKVNIVIDFCPGLSSITPKEHTPPTLELIEHKQKSISSFFKRWSDMFAEEQTTHG